MTKVATLACLLFVLLLCLPLSSGLRLIDDGEDRLKYGDYGDEVTYHIIVRNDNPTPKDIFASVGDHTWNVTIVEDEYLNVARNEDVVFTVIVEIPDETDLVAVETHIHIFDRDHMLFLSEQTHEGYQHRIREKLFTAISKQQNNPSAPKEMVANNPFIILFVGVILASGYVWYGRKYFFLAPLYMNIPKERLLNHESREKIFHYLSIYNGSNLSEISQGTGINIQTLRHHLKLFEHYNFVMKKEKRFFIKKPGTEVFDTKILPPVLQRVFNIILDGDGITVSNIVSTTKRSKPWIGNRIHELLTLDLIDIQKVGNYKYIYPKGMAPNSHSPKSDENIHPMIG